MSATTVPEPVQPEAVQTPAPTKENGQVNFDVRVKTDPEFAWGTVQNLQRKVTELTNRVKPLERVEQVVKATFGPAIAEGADQMIALANRGYIVDQNAELKRIVDDTLAGKRPAAPVREETHEEYLTPEEKKISALETELKELRNQFVQTDTRIARGELQSHLEGFFKSDIGRALEPSERQAVVETLQTQFTTWGKTPEGRRTLSNLAPDTIELVALQKLHQSGDLPNVYERMRVASQAKLGGAATDSPSLSSRRADDTPEVKNAKDALRVAAARFLDPADRQKLGW